MIRMFIKEIYQVTASFLFYVYIMCFCKHKAYLR